MSDRLTCSTCAFWRAGAAAAMDMPARDWSADSMGACEFTPPQVIVIDGGPVTVQPTTHLSRCCSAWTPDWPDSDDPNGPDGPGDGEPQPVPEPGESRVRTLFPVQPAPIAA